MSEFGLGNTQFRGGPGSAPRPQGSVEWYQGAGASTYPGAGLDYSYAEQKGHLNNKLGGETFEDEAPLLEELGIDLSGIMKRSRAVLINRFKAGDVDSLDLGGPLLFATALAAVHLLAGKLHFGVILGWSVVGSMGVWFVVNNMTGMDSSDSRPTGLYETTCLLGYGMLPLLLHALLCLLVPRGAFPAAMAVPAVLWAAITASRMFVRRSPALADLRWHIAYPCALMYAAFSLLTIY